MQWKSIDKILWKKVIPLQQQAIIAAVAMELIKRQLTKSGS